MGRSGKSLDSSRSDQCCGTCGVRTGRMKSSTAFVDRNRSLRSRARLAQSLRSCSDSKSINHIRQPQHPKYTQSIASLRRELPLNSTDSLLYLEEGAELPSGDLPTSQSERQQTR